MSDKEYSENRRAFVNGELDSLRLGGYGGTVNLEIVANGVRIKTSRPKQQQKTLMPNSRTVRETAVRAAEGILERLRGIPSPRKPSAPHSAQGGATRVGILTARQIWIAWLALKLGNVPADVLSWGRKDAADYIRGLTPQARRKAPSADYVYSVVLAARRLDSDRVVPFDGDFDDIQPGDLDTWVTTQLNRGASPHTVNTYRSRFRNVVRTFKKKWPHRWNKRSDPTKDITRVGTKHIRPPEVGEDNVERLLARLRLRGDWRVEASAKLVDTSARRIASISGGRDGMHIDAPPLCAADFRRCADGSYEVTWRADAQKGYAYERGDVVQKATRAMVVVYRWLRRFHPNPGGPQYPLIWSEDDHTRPESYHRLRKALEGAWKEEFNEPKPKQLGWHSFCRTTISTLVYEAGEARAADFTGRSVEVVLNTYRRSRRDMMDDTADRLDEFRRGRRGRRVRGGARNTEVGHA